MIIFSINCDLESYPFYLKLMFKTAKWVQITNKTDKCGPQWLKAFTF